MKDRRQFERYEIALPARMETIDSGKKHIFELKTRDISASGAFLDFKSPFPMGTRIKMSLSAKNKRIVELTGSQGLLECEGFIVRSSPQGMAICFDKECQIWSLKNSNS